MPEYVEIAKAIQVAWGKRIYQHPNAAIFLSYIINGCQGGEEPAEAVEYFHTSAFAFTNNVHPQAIELKRKLRGSVGLSTNY